MKKLFIVVFGASLLFGAGIRAKKGTTSSFALDDTRLLKIKWKDLVGSCTSVYMELSDPGFEKDKGLISYIKILFPETKEDSNEWFYGKTKEGTTTYEEDYSYYYLKNPKKGDEEFGEKLLSGEVPIPEAAIPYMNLRGVSRNTFLNFFLKSEDLFEKKNVPYRKYKYVYFPTQEGIDLLKKMKKLHETTQKRLAEERDQGWGSWFMRYLFRNKEQ